MGFQFSKSTVSKMSTSFFFIVSLRALNIV
jgi:hypothetical protein